MKFLITLSWLGAFAGAAFALEPKNVILVVNKNEPASREVAEHYCKLRDVPNENIIELDLPKSEDISRKDFDAKLRGPLREKLKDRREQVGVLLTVYGVPLRVGPGEPSEEDRAAIAQLEAERKSVQESIQSIDAELVKLDPMKEKDRAKELNEKKAKAEFAANVLRNRMRLVAYGESQAAVDSELMLLWRDKVDPRGWISNPLYYRYSVEERAKAEPVTLTCRLDGPTAEIAKRLVDDAIATEKAGVKGKVYIDARGIGYNPKNDPGGGYGAYDQSMRETAALYEKAKALPVVLDDKAELFAVGACPDTFLYCGWYSHAKFIDCCKFEKGAVAWHLASSECVSLKRKDAGYWCKNLLEKGACATLGPVAEPYTIGFPKPAEFFGFLGTGKYTLAECYGRTVMMASWMGVLIGDPLYTPFRNRPVIEEENVKPSPDGGRRLFDPPGAKPKSTP